MVQKDNPIYYGPTSTTDLSNVAENFSKGVGIIWKLGSSYYNPYKFIKGINVSWISCFKEESEIMLFNMKLPISSTKNYEDDIYNNVEHLLQTLKIYNNQIINIKEFYNKLGLKKKDEKQWIKIIKHNQIIYEKSTFKGKPILHRLVNELKLEN